MMSLLKRQRGKMGHRLQIDQLFIIDVADVMGMYRHDDGAPTGIDRRERQQNDGAIVVREGIGLIAGMFLGDLRIGNDQRPT